MIEPLGRIARAGGWACALALLLVPAAGRGEEYVVGPDDVLAISVWMHPELERTVTISADGNITFPPIGEFKAAGLTPKQLGDRLGDRLSAYLRQTATVTVTVTQFLSHSLYVSGAVARPGRYGFEHIPSLVDVISQAGGAVPGADLSRVQVVRREGDARRTLVADVSSALRDGVGAHLPALQAGDTVILPAGAGGAAAVAPGDGVGVLGEVNRPGIYAAGPGQDLWSVLAAAGGPTPRADLSNLRVVTRQQESQAVITINLQDVLRRGARTPFAVRPGDVVYVSPTGANAVGRTFGSFTQVLAVGRDLLNIAVLADVLKRGGR